MENCCKIECDCETPSVSMSLRSKVASETVTAAIYGLAQRIDRRGSGRTPLPNRVLLLAAIVADLLKGGTFDPVRPCYRPMGAANFTSGPFGYHSFKGVLDDLTAAEMVLVDGGWQNPATRKGRVTRIYPTDTLLSALAAFGITPASRNDHFAQRSDIPLIFDPIRLRERSTRNYRSIKHRGKPMPVDGPDPKVIALAADVTAINDYLSKQTLEGMGFDGLFRGFNNGNDPNFNWDKGGRLYAVGGGYQSTERAKRKLIRINGEETAEVDISGSHLTILHSLMKVNLPEGNEPYAIAGLDRDPVKRFVTATLGNGKVPIRWPADAATDYAEEFKKSPKLGYAGDLRKDYPFAVVRDKVLQHLPLLKQIERCPYGWAELQYTEANILIDAMKVLMKEGIPSLPVHDSLIVQKSKTRKAKQELSNSFYRITGIKPMIKVK